MKKHITALLLAAAAVLSGGMLSGVSVQADVREGDALAASGQQEEAKSTSPVKKVYTVSHSFGDGQKVTSVILEYGEEIDASSLSVSDYSVKDRTVLAVHTNDRAEETDVNVPGNYVVISLVVQPAILDDRYASDGRMDQQKVIDQATVVQTGEIRTAAGEVIPASAEEYTTFSGDGGIMGNDAIITPDLSRFEDNHYYNDPETHAILHYNLYKPEGYETSGQKYPLVLFIPDASAVGTDWETVLQCGNGGTIWASDDWQAGNPCFVVTMIYEDKYINDYNEYYESWLDGTMNLVRDLAEKYPVDSNRIYTTGTSMGAMASMVMMEKDQDLFAAAYMIAGQWRDTQAVKDIKNNNILFLMSEDDPSYSRAQANVDTWEAEGGKVVRTEIDVTDDEARAAAISNALTQEGNIYFLSIEAGYGSIDADGNPLPGGHRATFRVGYDLPCVKEWLFSQTK